jgi:hypothetical protein
MPVNTQGLISHTTNEINALKSIYAAGGSAGTFVVASDILRDANIALSHAVQPSQHVVTSGGSGQGASTSFVSHQSGDAWAAAMAYQMTGSASYLSKAKSFVLGWAQTNIPDSSPIANDAFMDMFKAYDLIRGNFTSAERTTVDHWLSGIADALIAGQAAAAASGSVTAGNNYRSHALLEVGAIGMALGNAEYIHYAADNFLTHVGNNLASFVGEPPHLGVDYHQRHAYHYVAYNLEALTELAVMLDRLGHVAGNPYGINYNPFTTQVNGASLELTLKALLPFASGEQQSLHEFEGSTNPNDAIRIAQGTLSSVFHPDDALPSVEAAQYFAHTVTDTSTGHSYNLAQVASGVLQGINHSVLTTDMPTQSFLLNDIDHGLFGNNNANTLNGSAGDDLIFSFKGNDVIRGNAGNDTIYGDSGTDTISGGTGNDALYGGAGSDKFFFNRNTGHDVVHDFASVDSVYISRQIYTSVSQIMSHVEYTGGNALIHLDGSNTVTLAGVSSETLHAYNFHLSD